MTPRHEDAQVLVVDDEPTIVRLLVRALEGVGYYHVEGLSDPAGVSPYLDGVTPDLVVLDIHMPGIDGYAILDDVSHRLSQDTFLPVLVISGSDDNLTRLRAIEAGAKDFLAKPIDVHEFLLHVDSLLDTRFVNRRLNETRGLLENLVRQRTQELRQAQLDFLERLGRVAEVRDYATGQHTSRVAHMSALLAQELGLPPGEVDLISRTAALHDLGKVAVPDKILLKNGGLTDEERSVMREHVLIGAQLLRGGGSEHMRMAESIALSHHERWDGSGYPHGLVGEDIPLEGRIVALADAFDALTHVRPYKTAWSVDEAMAEIRRESGRQFEPRLVEALDRIHRRLLGEVNWASIGECEPHAWQ